MHNHFSSEKSCLVYKMFLKFQNGHFDKVSISTLICLDALKADTVDDLSQSIENTNELLGGSSSFSKELADGSSVV